MAEYLNTLIVTSMDKKRVSNAFKVIEEWLKNYKSKSLVGVAEEAVDEDN